MPTSKLSGQNVLILGGTSGIGFAVAELCLAEGATVAISSSNQSKIDNATTRLLSTSPFSKDHITGHICNLSDSATLEINLATLFSTLLPEKMKPLDHIVFTAGDALAVSSPAGYSTNLILSAGTVRFLAPLILAKVAIPYLRKAKSSSLTLTSGTVAERPQAGWAIPAAYAAAVHGIVRGLARDLMPIRVNAVSPGAVMTELWDGIPEGQRQGVWGEIAKGHTTGEMGQPEHVAEAYLYFIKDWNCSGSVVKSNGGVLLL